MLCGRSIAGGSLLPGHDQPSTVVSLLDEEPEIIREGVGVLEE